MNPVETLGISFTYDDGTRALDGVNFVLREKEFVGLLASNGGGKTTLLKSLVGLLQPQQGEILIKGQKLKSIPQGELYQKVGMVFQNPNDQLFAPTVIEDVAFGPLNMGLQPPEAVVRAEEALTMVDMLHCKDKPIHHLSFGQQKRVCIAGVLAMRPEILILDEPTAGLDPLGESDAMQLLKRLNREQGITIVMATHSVDMIPLFIDRLYILNKGRVVGEGSPPQIFSDVELLRGAQLRLPYIALLIEELKKKDGFPIDGFPLTVGDARRKLVELLPRDIVANKFKTDPSAASGGTSKT